MIWFVAPALGAWVFILSFQLGDLRAHVRNLERRLAELKAKLDEGVQPAAKPARPKASTKAESVADEPREVLGLSQRGQPETVAEAAPAAPRIDAPTIRLRPLPPPRPAEPPLRDVIRAWLEENGLAWAGGAALALGGLFLVTYAAQRGVFTPPFRIAAAVITGFVLLGASEWLKSKVGNPLAAALAAGAGAATLYGAAWASYWLYAFIGLAPAAGLMAIISFALLALAFRHGEPLAMLAVFGGFMAPVVTGPQEWSAPALTGYLALMIATGFAVAAARAWGRTGVTALAGAFLWGVAGFAAEDNARVVALAVAPMLLAYAAVEWRRRKGEAVIADPGPVNPFITLPAFALIAAGLLVVTAWFSTVGAPGWRPSPWGRSWSRC